MTFKSIWEDLKPFFIDGDDYSDPDHSKTEDRVEYYTDWGNWGDNLFVAEWSDKDWDRISDEVLKPFEVEIEDVAIVLKGETKEEDISDNSCQSAIDDLMSILK